MEGRSHHCESNLRKAIDTACDERYEEGLFDVRLHKRAWASGEVCERACVRVAVAVRKLLKQTAGARDDASEDGARESLSGAAVYWLVG